MIQILFCRATNSCNIVYGAFVYLNKKFQHICVSLDVNFNESLTNDVVSFEQLGPDQAARLRECAGSYDISKSVMFRRTFCFNRQRIPDQAAWMRRLIWVFAVLMGCTFFQQAANPRSGCVDA